MKFDLFKTFDYIDRPLFIHGHSHVHVHVAWVIWRAHANRVSRYSARAARRTPACTRNVCAPPHGTNCVARRTGKGTVPLLVLLVGGPGLVCEQGQKPV